VHVVHQTSKVLQFTDLCHYPLAISDTDDDAVRTVLSLFLCRKLHSFLGKAAKTAATRAAVSNSYMHQLVCRLGLRPYGDPLPPSCI